MKKNYRDATMKYYKLCHAWEEIERLNIEVGRLQSFIYEETEHTEHVVEELSQSEPSLAAKLSRRWILPSSINAFHLLQLRKLECEPYYTGSQDLGESTEGPAGVFTLGRASLYSLEEELVIESENEHRRENGNVYIEKIQLNSDIFC
jgi:hypothetical protein